MKLAAVVPMFLLLSLSVPSEAQTWSGVFVAVKKITRVDYFPDKRGFQLQEDETPDWRYEIRIPAAGPKAYVRMIPPSQENKPIEDHEVFVISRDEDMTTLALPYADNEKIEIYTLYPKFGMGFLTDTSAFLGNYLMKFEARINPIIPYASAKVIPLRLINR